MQVRCPSCQFATIGRLSVLRTQSSCTFLYSPASPRMGRCRRFWSLGRRRPPESKPGGSLKDSWLGVLGAGGLMLSGRSQAWVYFCACYFSSPLSGQLWRTELSGRIASVQVRLGIRRVRLRFPLRALLHRGAAFGEALWQC